MLNWTEEQYQRHLAKLRGEVVLEKKGKIPAQKVVHDGFTFDSLAEMWRYKELRLLEAGGMIRNLRVHTKWGLVVKGNKVGVYTDDFNYEERTKHGWVFVCEDVKSTYTRKDRSYRRARKLMLAIHGVTIREVVR